MIAMRYGSVPIARETGGLRDTVLSYNKFTDEGNGFTFFNYNAHDMLHTVRRAVHYYQNNREVWYRLIVRGMTGDYSWYSSAGKYMALYEDVTRPATSFTLTEETPENPKTAPASQAEVGDVKEAAKEAPKAEEKPKAKRGPRKKAVAEVAEVKEEAKEAPKAEEKPKAKRGRKKAEPKVEAVAEVAEVKEEAKEAPKAEEKPKARRGRKKAEPKVEAVAEVAEVKEEAKEAPKAEEKPKAKRGPRKKAEPKTEPKAE